LWKKDGKLFCWSFLWVDLSADDQFSNVVGMHTGDLQVAKHGR
jgi:hypothetical protein